MVKSRRSSTDVGDNREPSTEDPTLDCPNCQTPLETLPPDTPTSQCPTCGATAHFTPDNKPIADVDPDTVQSYLAKQRDAVALADTVNLSDSFNIRILSGWGTLLFAISCVFTGTLTIVTMLNLLTVLPPVVWATISLMSGVAILRQYLLVSQYLKLIDTTQLTTADFLPTSRFNAGVTNQYKHARKP